MPGAKRWTTQSPATDLGPRQQGRQKGAIKPIDRIGRCKVARSRTTDIATQKMRNIIKDLLRRNLMTPLLGAIAFAVVVLSPLLIAGLDANTFRATQQEQSKREYRYDYKPEALRRLEKLIAKTNDRESDFQEARAPMFIDIEVERVRDINLANKTAYVSGIIKGVWSAEASVSRGGIGPKRSYASSRIENAMAAEDLMNEIEVAGLIKDDFFEYKRISHQRLQGKAGYYYVSEYKFAGNCIFEPSLSDYPIDKQYIEIALSHRKLPSYRLKLKAIKAQKNALPSDLFVQNFRISEISNRESYIELPEDNDLKEYLVKGTGWERIKGRAKNRTSEINDAYFSNERGPASVAAWRIELTRQLSTTWLRYVFPVSLLLIALVITSYIPTKFTEVRLAIPPTVLLSLVFLQQGSTQGIPDLGKPMLLDYYYLMAYVATLVSFFEFIFSAHYSNDERNQKNLTIKRLSRITIMFCASLGAPMIWMLGRLF